MTINTSGFQACDIRGRFGNTPQDAISATHAFLIGRAVAEQVPAGERLVVAGDGRSSTPMLLRSLRSGFGRESVDLGAGVPTPLAYLAREMLGAHSVAIVTASHQPEANNGFKIQIGDRPPTPALISGFARRVQELFAGDVPRHEDDNGTGHASDILDQVWSRYLDHLAETVPTVDGMGVVVDAMHGAYAGHASNALRGAGFSVTAIRDEPAGDFRGITPDPSDDGELDELRRAVTGNEAAFGVAFDGDGDRARLVDDRGRLVDNGTTLVLLYRWLGRDAGRVVCDQKTRRAVLRSLREAGATTLLAPSGHAFIRTHMLDENALLGGEISGHFFWGADTSYPVPAGDCGLYVPFVIGDLLSRTGRPLSDLCDEVPSSPHYTGDIRGLRYAGDRAALLTAIASAAQSSGATVHTADGVRIETPTAFALIRPSVTEPDILTAVLDADDERTLIEVADMLRTSIPADATAIAASIGRRLTSRR